MLLWENNQCMGGKSNYVLSQVGSHHTLVDCFPETSVPECFTPYFITLYYVHVILNHTSAL